MEEVRQAAAVPSFVAVSHEVRDICASRLLSLLGSFHDSSGAARRSDATSSAAGGEGAEGAANTSPVASTGGLSDTVQLALMIRGSSKAAKSARETTARQLDVLQALQNITMSDADGVQVHGPLLPPSCRFPRL